MVMTPAQIKILEEEEAAQSLTPKQRQILEEEEKKKPESLSDYDPVWGKKAPYSLPNIMGAAIEPGLALGTGAIAYPLGLMSALGSHWKELAGAETAGPAANRQSVMEGMTYQPRTPGGKAGYEGIVNALTLGGSIPKVAQWTGEQAGGGHYGALTEEAINLAPALIGARAMPRGRAIPESITQQVAKPVKYVGDMAGRGKDYVKHALTTRFSKGEMDSMLGQMLNDITGNRNMDVIRAIEQAPDGVTAAQAAVPAGSAEFSALQKLTSDWRPSELYALEKQQAAGRRGAIQENIARTPEEIAIAEALLEKEAAQAYGKSRNVPVDPRSNKQKLVEASIKAKENAEKARIGTPKRDAEGKIIGDIGGYTAALQDAGRFETLAQNQATRALRQPPMVDPMQTRLTGQRAPTSAQMGDVPGQPRVPPRYTPQRAVEQDATAAAVEARNIANYRKLQESTNTGISETFLLNTTGETGAPLSKFLDRPSIKQAIRRARLAAQETGTYWPKSPDEPFTVGNLQRIKREVADTVAEAAKEGRMGKTTRAERTGTVSEFTDWLRSKSSDFAKAEDLYAERIQPINQMKYGQEVLKKMDDRLYDEGERPRQFIAAKEEGGKIIKKLTGREIAAKDFLTEKQMKTMENVEGQYIRDAELSKMSSKGLKKLNKELGNVFDIPTFGILERTMVIINTIIKRIEGKSTEAALNRLAELTLDKKEMARIMRAALPEERAVLEQHMNAKTKAAVASMIASEQENE